MPGMNSGLSPADPTLVAAFRSALLHQGAIALLIIVFLGLAWATARAWRRPASGAPAEAGAERAVAPEARGRRLLRVGFGLLWILDGILQAQPKMAGGLAVQVIEPTAAASPAWVQHVANWGGTIWSYHPIQSGAATVWIQVGLGAWLLVAAHGPWSRLAGLATVAWGLVVWVFGESFGGIFAPGLSWLTGAPGAVLLYVVAGALIALPEDAWRRRAARAAAAGRDRAVLHRHGRAAGLAGPRLLAGHRPRPARHPGRHGPADGLDPAAARAVRPGGQVRLVRREQRLRGEPGGGDRARGDGRGLPDRTAPAGPVRRVVRPGVLPGGLGAGPGLRLPGRARHRPEQHDPAGSCCSSPATSRSPRRRTRRSPLLPRVPPGARAGVSACGH